MELEVGTNIGEYEVTGRLGAGAMGVVYAGVHPLIGKKVAIKVLNTEMTKDEQVIKRFVNEARAVNQIDHPNIVDIFAFGELEDGAPYLVMPHLEGRTFGALLRERDTLSADEVLEILEPVAEAVDAAHGAGIIHRDLKPDNIFLVERPNGRVDVRVLDFGVAKLLDSTVSSTKGPIGTPLYMAPEQCIANREVDGRADVYAFGVLAFHALTARYPIEATSLVKLVSLHLQGTEPERPSSFGASAVLDAPVLRCLAADPDHRFATLSAAFAALSVAVGEMTDSANPIEATAPDAFSATIPSTAPSHHPPQALASTLSSAARAKETNDTEVDDEPRAKWPLFAAGAAVLAGVAVAFAFAFSGGESGERGTAANEPKVALADATPEPVPDAAVAVVAVAPADAMVNVKPEPVAKSAPAPRAETCEPERPQDCRTTSARLVAVRKLVRGRSGKKMSILRRLAQRDRSARVRLYAIKAIGQLVTPRTADAVKASTLNLLIRLSTSEPNRSARKAAYDAYHRVASMQGRPIEGPSGKPAATAKKPKLVYIRVGSMKARDSAQRNAMAASTRIAVRKTRWATLTPQKTGWVISGSVKSMKTMPMTGRAICVVVLTMHTLDRRGHRIFDQKVELPASGKTDSAAAWARSGCAGGAMAELVEKRALPLIKKAAR